MSTEALNDLFQSALDMEEFARDLYADMMEKMNDDKVKKVLERIKLDEEKHIENVKRILEIIST